jgi:hypothetical protein
MNSPRKKQGILEEWNIGMMGGKLKFLNPIFHSSIVPLFRNHPR